MSNIEPQKFRTPDGMVTLISFGQIPDLYWKLIKRHPIFPPDESLRNQNLLRYSTFDILRFAFVELAR